MAAIAAAGARRRGDIQLDIRQRGDSPTAAHLSRDHRDSGSLHGYHCGVLHGETVYAVEPSTQSAQQSHSYVQHQQQHDRHGAETESV